MYNKSSETALLPAGKLLPAGLQASHFCLPGKSLSSTDVVSLQRKHCLPIGKTFLPAGKPLSAYQAKLLPAAGKNDSACTQNNFACKQNPFGLQAQREIAMLAAWEPVAPK